jgi:hypothetical protein
VVLLLLLLLHLGHFQLMCCCTLLLLLLLWLPGLYASQQQLHSLATGSTQQLTQIVMVLVRLRLEQQRQLGVPPKVHREGHVCTGTQMRGIRECLVPGFMQSERGVVDVCVRTIFAMWRLHCCTSQPSHGS